MKTAIITNLIILFALSLSHAQTINTEIDPDSDSPYLLGEINKEGLTSEHYNTWFSENYDDYKIDEAVIKNIASSLNNYQITIFMGTWCGDSKREVPHFYKILEACNFPMEQLTAVALSRNPDMYKQSPNHEELGLNIHRVPTFIFYKEGQEVNRIVEEPVKTLEADIESILNNSYKSQYQVVFQVNEIIDKSGIKGLKKSSKSIIKSFKNELESMYELNTYAHILFKTDRKEEAIEVLKLNTKLFPEKSRTYQNLGNKYYKMSNTKKAKKQYKKALKLDPENAKLQEVIKSL